MRPAEAQGLTLRNSVGLPVDRISRDVQDPEGCVVPSADAEYEFTTISQPFSSSVQMAETWGGQNLSFDQITESTNAESACFDGISNFKFQRIINGQIETFQVVGTAWKVRDLEPNALGISRALYNLPSDFFYSQSGRYMAWSGTVEATCVQAEMNINLGLVMVHVDVTAYRTRNYNGHIYNVDESSAGGNVAGWGYYDSSTNYSNGNVGGWQDALNTYLNSGTCTDRWDIFVDGQQVCKDGQLVNQT